MDSRFYYLISAEVAAVWSNKLSSFKNFKQASIPRLLWACDFPSLSILKRATAKLISQYLSILKYIQPIEALSQIAYELHYLLYNDIIRLANK